jgi:coproporphyrinogen III oxidase
MPQKEEIADWFRELQDDICQQLEQTDGKAKFHEDNWDRPGGGGGRTRIMRDGNIIEKGGVNFSAVHGELPSKIKEALGVDGENFYATGISIVIHPINPWVPIIHMNTRYFEISGETYWFGGGIDLTPHYIDKEQARFFHKQIKEVCDRYDANYYPEHKKWADDYFFIKHRDETRGVGGIFFDKMKEDKEHSKRDIFNYVRDVGKLFAPVYTKFMKQGAKKPYGEDEKQWKLLRRGRYVEFNLVYDKGTKFGLDTSGRIESILMSLPKLASWEYNVVPEPQSNEEETLNLLRKEIDWINI